MTQDADLSKALEAVRVELRQMSGEVEILKQQFQALQEVDALEDSDEDLEDEEEDDEEEEEEDDEEEESTDARSMHIIAWQDMAEAFTSMVGDADLQSLLPPEGARALDKWTSRVAIQARAHRLKTLRVAQMRRVLALSKMLTPKRKARKTQFA